MLYIYISLYIYLTHTRSHTHTHTHTHTHAHTHTHTHTPIFGLVTQRDPSVTAHTYGTYDIYGTCNLFSG